LIKKNNIVYKNNLQRIIQNKKYKNIIP